MYLAQHYLEESAILEPKKTAIICSNSRITYMELNRQSNKLANSLIERGVKRQDRVIIFLKRSTEHIISFMGIIKADAIYVPVDPCAPANRTRTIVEDCRPAAIICNKETVYSLDETLFEVENVPKIIFLDSSDCLEKYSRNNITFKEEIDANCNVAPEYQNIDTDIAYIMYTSGSSGRPKGVLISHLNIINYIEWAVSYLGIGSEDKIFSTAPFHFDMSTFDIYAAMKARATLVIANEKCLLFPKMIFDVIEINKITIWKAISSLLVYFVKTNVLKIGRIKTLKKILFAGETLPPKYLIELMRIFPEKQFYNAYGPTEATGISTYYLVKNIPLNHEEGIPIGKACTNSEIILLNENNMLCKKGQVGEICIRGSCLSIGYWNDGEKTEKSFIQNPLNKVMNDRIYRTNDLGRIRDDGEIEFLGRRDLQVKYMGYRIELFEIEKAMLRISDINDAAVVLVSSSISDVEELVGFYESEQEIDVIELKNKLQSWLPQYMIPKNILKIKILPRSDRGKIDRKALATIFMKE
jgi:amino acid adenylation domain-containing protein